MTTEMSRMPPRAKRCRANRRFFPGGDIGCSGSSGGVVSSVAVLFVSSIVWFSFRFYQVTLRSLEKAIRLKGILQSVCFFGGVAVFSDLFELTLRSLIF